ncbi:MAG: hypothetical protein R3A47_01240 [Polyangiales bacterium]
MNVKSSLLLVVAALLLIVVPDSGCDTTKLTADTTTGLFTRATPALEQYWDYDTAGKALPASIVQFEGILRVVPDNEALTLAQSVHWCRLRWVEDAVKQAEIDGDTDEAERLQKRAQNIYVPRTSASIC